MLFRNEGPDRQSERDIAIAATAMSSSRPRTTSFVEGSSKNNPNFGGGLKISSKDGSKVMTVIASPGQGPDMSTEVSYTDTKASSWARVNFVSDLSDAPYRVFESFRG